MEEMVMNKGTKGAEQKMTSKGDIKTTKIKEIQAMKLINGIDIYQLLRSKSEVSSHICSLLYTL